MNEPVPVSKPNAINREIAEMLIEDMAMYELRLDDANPEVGPGLMIHGAIKMILDKYKIPKDSIDFDKIAANLVERRHSNGRR